MALKQPNSNAVWAETKASGAAGSITPISLVADAYSGYTVAPSAGLDARILADAYSGFTVSDGDSNPSALAELRMVDYGNGFITLYE